MTTPDHPDLSLQLVIIQRLRRELAEEKAKTERLEKALERLQPFGKQLLEGFRELRREVHINFKQGEMKMAELITNLESLKDAVNAQGDVIRQEAQEVKDRMDEQARLIEELRQNASDPAKVAEIGGLLEQNNQAVRDIFTREPTPGRGKKG